MGRQTINHKNVNYAVPEEGGGSFIGKQSKEFKKERNPSRMHVFT